MGGAGPVLLVRRLGMRGYEHTWREMRAFTDARDADTPDEVWLLEHPPVYTLGQAGRTQHVRAPGGVPVVKSDRGGQVTYHGPGQLVVYTLLDLRRLGIGVRTLVERLEECVILLLRAHRVHAMRRARAPGVYVDGAKLSALGLRIRNGCSYHGLALNVDLDRAPFERIDPCGYPQLQVTRLVDLGVAMDVSAAGTALAELLAEQLGLAPTMACGAPSRRTRARATVAP